MAASRVTVMTFAFYKRLEIPWLAERLKKDCPTKLITTSDSFILRNCKDLSCRRRRCVLQLVSVPVLLLWNPRASCRTVFLNVVESSSQSDKSLYMLRYGMECGDTECFKSPCTQSPLVGRVTFESFCINVLNNASGPVQGHIPLMRGQCKVKRMYSPKVEMRLCIVSRYVSTGMYWSSARRQRRRCSRGCKLTMSCRTALFTWLFDCKVVRSVCARTYA
jgi:hypothetical protein